MMDASSSSALVPRLMMVSVYLESPASTCDTAHDVFLAGVSRV